MALATLPKNNTNAQTVPLMEANLSFAQAPAAATVAPISYTVKAGDTLSKIANQYGVNISDITGYASGNQNLIRVGETLNIGGIAPAAPVKTQVPDQVSIGNVSTNPVIPPASVPVDTSSTATTSKTTPTFLETPAPATNEPATAEDILKQRQTQLASDITVLEKSIADRTANRNTALDTAGVFTDMQKLNELKSQLQTVQDRALEIPIEARQTLRGTGATISEYQNLTTPQLENQALAELAASRQVSRLADVIQTNVAIVDAKLKADNDQADFVYKQKQKELENVQKIYGDIMTEKQKIALEERKFKNEVALEQLKFGNTIMADAQKEAFKAGVNPTAVSAAVATGDPSKVYALVPGVAAQQGANAAVNTVNLVDSMLSNSKGLSGSVGGFLGKSLIASGKDETFRTDAKSLVSAETLAYYNKLKSSGASFGSMTESEWGLLTQASPAASLGIDPSTGKSNLPEKEFIARLQAYQNASKKVATAVALNSSGIGDAILKNSTPKQIDSYYDIYVKNPATAPVQDYTQSDVSQQTLDFIGNKEGFRSQAYQDQGGKWTIGYGTTAINGVPVKQGDTITEPQARALMQKQIVENYTNFTDKITTNISPNAFTALTSFEYNLGPNIWNQPGGSRIIAAINAGNLQEAGRLMQSYVNVRNPQTGKLEPSNGLLARRQEEARLLLA